MRRFGAGERRILQTQGIGGEKIGGRRADGSPGAPAAGSAADNRFMEVPETSDRRCGLDAAAVERACRAHWYRWGGMRPANRRMWRVKMERALVACLADRGDGARQVRRG